MADQSPDFKLLQHITYLRGIFKRLLSISFLAYNGTRLMLLCGFYCRRISFYTCCEPLPSLLRSVFAFPLPLFHWVPSPPFIKMLLWWWLIRKGLSPFNNKPVQLSQDKWKYLLYIEPVIPHDIHHYCDFSPRADISFRYTKKAENKKN